MKVTYPATSKVLEDLQRLAPYYEPIKCYLINDRGYEEAPCWEIASFLKGGRAKRNLYVENRRTGDKVKVNEGDAVNEVSFHGNIVYLAKDVGNFVRKGDKLAFIETKKGGTRVVRSPFEGVLVLITEDLKEQPVKYFIYIIHK